MRLNALVLDLVRAILIPLGPPVDRRIELEPEKVSTVWDEVTSDFSKHARIPGYRLGKAPKAVVEKKFKKEIREELEKKLLSGACREAIQEKNLRVLSLTQIDDVELADDKSMKFTATLITHPDFQLPNYKGLVVPMHSTEVTDEEYQQVMAKGLCLQCYKTGHRIKDCKEKGQKRRKPTAEELKG